MVGPVLVAADLAALGDEDLVALFRSEELQRRRREVLVARVVAEVERRGLHLDDGHRSVQAWCRSTGRWSPNEARAAHRLSKLLRRHGPVGDAAARGDVPVAQLHEIARGAANPRCGSEIDEVLTILLNEVSKLEYVDFRTLVRRWESYADADGAHRDAEETHERRRASIVEHDGVVTVTATFGALQGAAVAEIFRRFCDAQFRADWDQAKEELGDRVTKSHLARTDAQRRADALFAVFDKAACTARDAQQPEPLVNIVVDWDTFCDEVRLREQATSRTAGPGHVEDPPDARTDVHADRHAEGPDDVSGAAASSPTDDTAASGASATPRFDPRRRRCETASGAFVTPADAVDAALIGRVRRVVFDARGVVLDMGRRSRLFRGAAREAVLLSTTRCPGSGCLVHSGRQADHETPWGADGITATINGAPPCGHHNRLKNRGFRIERDDTGHWHTYRPDGTEVGESVH